MASTQTDAVAPPNEGVSILAPPIGGPASSLRSSPSIARQTSIYSLTLDEFQSVLGEPAKNFGSMNMDDFLKNIWTVEESQAMAAAMGGGSGGFPPSEELHHGIQRQPSISLPRTLSRKTVDDVWKDIARSGIDGDSNPVSGGSSSHERQITFGEMTLEDFLVKAGAVKKDDPGSGSLFPYGTSFESLPPAATVLSATDNGNRMGDRYGEMNGGPFNIKGSEGEKARVRALPMLSLAGGPNLPTKSQDGPTMNHVSPLVQPPEWLANNGFKTDMTYGHPPMNNMLHQHGLEVGGARKGGLIGGLGGLGADLGVNLMGGCDSPSSLIVKAGSPQSPMMNGMTPSYDSMALHSPLPYGTEGVMRGRKRDFEGTLEKVVERRQKRMIKNRESAARSRARKQAYTVELEAEVSHLKEENMRLRRHEEELAEQRRRQLIDVLTSFRPKFMPKACRLRRTHTGP